jgi:hypothetical protein
VDGGARVHPADPVLSDGDMPSLYRVADIDATNAQKRFLRFQLAEILLPLVGVAFGVVLAHFEKSWKWVGLVAGGIVAVAALLRVLERTSGVEALWYRSRSCAETIKSLAWRYAVGVAPFPLDASDDAANAAFIDHLRHAAQNWPNASPAIGDEITPAMRVLRSQPLAARIDAYTRGRLVDQDHWYARKAIQANRSARRWDNSFYVLVGASVLAGVVMLTTSAAVIFVVVAGASAGAVLTWSSVRRLSSNAHVYRAVATDLSFFRSLVPNADKPDEWDHFVTAVEQRIAAENQRWQAARL